MLSTAYKTLSALLCQAAIQQRPTTICSILNEHKKYPQTCEVGGGDNSSIGKDPAKHAFFYWAAVPYPISIIVFYLLICSVSSHLIVTLYRLIILTGTINCYWR